MKRRPQSAPASPRAASTAQSADVVLTHLTKVEHARLTLESQNYIWSQTHKAAAARRKAWLAQFQESSMQERVQNALFTKESVRSGMRNSVKQAQEQASQQVSAQREHLQAIAARRDQIRAEHAARGKTLHGQHYGADAGTRRAEMMASKNQERRQLGEKGAMLAEEMNAERAAGYAARSASAERVRQQSGFHVMKRVLASQADARQAEGRAKRTQSAEWHNLIGASRQQYREQVEESKGRVLAVEAHARELRKENLAEKKLRAQLVREANMCVNAAVDEGRQNTARRRRAVHDWVAAEKCMDAPLPPLSAAAGGLAGSRKGSAATLGRARTSLSPTAATRESCSPSTKEHHPSTKGAGYIFEPGPSGLAFAETAAGVVVSDVAAGSAASNLLVPVGGLVLAVNSQPVRGLSRIGVQRAIAKANWPMTLLISPCSEHTFVGKGAVGLSLQDTQNGVVIKDIAQDSPAHKQGMQVGGLIVTINSTNATGLGKADVAQHLKSRPLSLQVAPRDVAYLFRPRGPYRKKDSA